MTESTDKPTKTSRKWFLILLGVLILIPGLFHLLSASVNSTRLPEELLEPPPDIFLTHSIRPEKSTPDIPKADDPDYQRHDSYEDYIKARLALDPSLEAARLYLELAERKEEIDEAFGIGPANWRPGDDPPPETPFRRRPKAKSSGWQPGRDTIDPAQAQWLRDHADLIDLILRFSEAKGFPSPKKESVRPSTQVPQFLMFQMMGKLMTAEGRRALQENDPARAVRAYKSAYSFGGHLADGPFLISRLIAIALVNQANRSVAQWIGETEYDREPLHALLPRLDVLHGRFYTQPLKSYAMESEYRSGRRQIVQALNGPWQSEMFGWDVGKDYHKYHFTNRWVDLPRLDRMAVTAFKAMHKKRNAPQSLREYDDYWKMDLQRVANDYPTMMAQSPTPINYSNFLFMHVPSFDEAITRDLTSEAELNLNRAALDMLFENGAPPPADASLADSHEHRWRDPFTERPLQMIEMDEAVNIWSFGPDGIDQSGLLYYDPTNGTTSAGDLAIHFPKMR